MIWGPWHSQSQARSRRRIYPSEDGAEIPPSVARLPGGVCQADGLSPASPVMAFSGRGCRGAWVICAGVAAVRVYVAVGARVKCRAPEVLHPSGGMLQGASAVGRSCGAVILLLSFHPQRTSFLRD